jgi:hypothetical protein
LGEERTGVKRGGGLVEEQDLGVADQRARDGHALLLAAGEQDALGARHGVETVTGNVSLANQSPKHTYGSDMMKS